MTTLTAPFPSRLGDPRRLARWASVVILALVALSAYVVFPFLSGLPDVTGVYRTPQPTAFLRPGGRMPVYDLLDAGRSVRSGIAVIADDGGIRVSRYDGGSAEAAGHEVVLLPSSIRTLWVLAGERERAELKESANAFARAVGDALDRTASSPAFEREYLPVLTDLVRAAVTAAWNDPGVQAAFAELMRVADPLIRQVGADELRPALVERLEPALWQAVRSNAANILDVFSGFEFDFRPLEAAVSGAIGDRRVRDGVRDILAVLAGTPQMGTLAERMAGVFVRTLRDDPRLMDTATRLLSDGRFAAYLEPIGDPALTLARAIPRTLARLDEQAELNSLAADIFKTQARGFSGQVVIFMPASERTRIAAADPSMPITLVEDRAP